MPAFPHSLCKERTTCYDSACRYIVKPLCRKRGNAWLITILVKRPKPCCLRYLLCFSRFKNGAKPCCRAKRNLAFSMHRQWVMGTIYTNASLNYKKTSLVTFKQCKN